jgi:hypothetical protein
MSHPLDRRRFLAVTGATALAGCNFLSNDEPTYVDGERLREMAREDAPTVEETLPVRIEESLVAEFVTRAEDLLAETPGTFDAEAIPNGVIRQRLNRHADATRERLEEVSQSESPYRRLSIAGDARSDAREVHGAWRAIDEGLTIEDVGADAPTLRDEAHEFAREWTYVGEIPVRALRVHAEIEQQVYAAVQFTDPERYEPAEGTNPLDIGEAAADVERSRVALITARHLLERFQGALDEGADLRDRFAAVRRTLETRREEQVASLPEQDGDDGSAWLVDRDVGRTAGFLALQELYGDAKRLRRYSGEYLGPTLAQDIVHRTRSLVYLRAFEHLRERIKGGDDVAVETAEDVVELRDLAVMEVGAAHDGDSAPELTNELLPGVAVQVEWADSRFSDPPGGNGEFTVTEANHNAADYVHVAEVCAALPDVCDSVTASLHNGTA